MILGDVVVAVGSQPVTSVEEFLSTIEEFDVGDLVPLTLYRYDQSTNQFRKQDVHVRTFATP